MEVSPWTLDYQSPLNNWDHRITGISNLVKQVGLMHFCVSHRCFSTAYGLIVAWDHFVAQILGSSFGRLPLLQTRTKRRRRTARERWTSERRGGWHRGERRRWSACAPGATPRTPCLPPGSVFQTRLPWSCRPPGQEDCFFNSNYCQTWVWFSLEMFVPFTWIGSVFHFYDKCSLCDNNKATTKLYFLTTKYWPIYWPSLNRK